jgi:transposase
LQGLRGRPRYRPDCILGDRAYNAEKLRGVLRARHISPLLAMRNRENGSGLGRWRWVIERTFAWLNQFRRLRRYEKRDCDAIQRRTGERKKTRATRQIIFRFSSADGIASNNVRLPRARSVCTSAIVISELIAAFKSLVMRNIAKRSGLTMSADSALNSLSCPGVSAWILGRASLTLSIVRMVASNLALFFASPGIPGTVGSMNCRSRDQLSCRRSTQAG